MVDVLFIGPCSDITSLLVSALSKDQLTKAIQFDNETNLDEGCSWSSHTLSNFHDLTIDIMEAEPDIVIYYPTYLNYQESEKMPDLAFLSNEEAVRHIRDVVSVHNSRFILFSSDLVLSSQDSILRNSISLGEEIARRYGRTTIIRLSPFVEQVNLLPGKGEVQLLDIKQFVSVISSILLLLENDTYNFAGDTYKGYLNRPTTYMDDNKIRALMDK